MNSKIFKALIIPSLFTAAPCLFLKNHSIFHIDNLIVYLAGFILIISQPNDSYSLLVKTKEKYTADKKSAEAILIAVYATILLWTFINFRVAHDRELYSLSPNSYIAISLLFLGAYIRVSTIRFMGKNFSTKVMTQKNQTLIQSGTFKYIRHPTYLGAMLIYSSVPIAWKIPTNYMALGIAILLLAYLYRIHVEEIALESHFKDEYLLYKLKTKKLVPFIF